MTTINDILPPKCILKEKSLKGCEDCAGYDRTCEGYLTKSMHDKINYDFCNRELDRIRRYNDSGVVA